LFNPENTKQLTYLHERGLDDTAIEHFGFGYAVHGRDLILRMATNANNMFGTNRDLSLVWNEQELLDAGLITIIDHDKPIDFFNDRITVPIHDNNGYLVGFSGRSTQKDVEPKYLNTSTTKLFTKANVLYNFYQVKALESEKIILVEGFMDAIAYYRAGFKYAVALMGTALSNEHLSVLSTLSKLKVVILSFDNDHAGIEATINNGQKLMENGFNVYVAGNYDRNIKDVDELLKTRGANAVVNILDERIDYFTFLINYSFNKKLPLDEIQIQAEKIIKAFIEFGDSSEILRAKQLKFLAEKSCLEYEDLVNKYQHDFNNHIKASATTKTTYVKKPTKPTNTIGLNQTFIEQSDIQEIQIIPKSNINQLIIAQKDDIKLILKRVNEGFDELICTIIVHPTMINDVTNKLTISVDFEFEQQRYIIKSMQSLAMNNQTINETNLVAFLQQEANKSTKVANEYEKAKQYLSHLINSSFHKLYTSLPHANINTKIDEIIRKIQMDKYNLIVAKKSLQILELSLIKPIDANTQTKINELSLQINAIKANAIQLKRNKTKS
jgi:DNA primase